MQEILEYQIAATSGAVLTKVGHHLADTLIFCRYNNRKCDMKDFELWKNPKYGICYTFNMNKSAAVVSNGGHKGLHVGLRTHSSDYLCLTESLGYKVMVHEQGQRPPIATSGLYVAPGFQNDISVNSEEYKFNSDCESEHDDANLNNEAYSAESCRQSCMQDAVIAMCNCTHPMLPKKQGFHSCGIGAKSCVDCGMDSIIGETAFKMCRCKRPCREKVFSPTTSKSGYATNAIESVCAGHRYFKRYCHEAARKEIVSVSVYFGKGTRMEFIEGSDYTGVDMMMDIRGSMWIFLGASMITLVEALVLPFACLFGTPYGDGKKPKKKDDLYQDPNNFALYDNYF